MFNFTRIRTAVMAVLALVMLGVGSITAPAQAQGAYDIDAGLLKGGENAVFPALAEEAVTHRFCREEGGGWIDCEFTYERDLGAYQVTAWEEPSFTVTFNAGEKPAGVQQRHWNRQEAFNGTWRCGFVRTMLNGVVQQDKTPMCLRTEGGHQLWRMPLYGDGNNLFRRETLWGKEVLAVAARMQQPAPVQVAVAPAPAPKPAVKPAAVVAPAPKPAPKPVQVATTGATVVVPTAVRAFPHVAAFAALLQQPAALAVTPDGRLGLELKKEPAAPAKLTLVKLGQRPVKVTNIAHVAIYDLNSTAPAALVLLVQAGGEWYQLDN